MNFKEFWNTLQNELKQEKELVTLRQKRKFKACLGYVKEELVVLVTPESSMIQRGRIPHNEFEGIWNDVKTYSHETRFVNKDGRLGSFINKNGKKGTSNNLSYIIKLIEHVVKDQDMN
jgi:hypothetical protein